MVGLVAADGGPITWPLHTSMLIAKEFAFTGDRITAERAHQLGLTNHVCAPDDVFDAALACARRVAALPQYAVESTKRILNIHMERSVLATIDFALGAEFDSFDTDDLRGFISRTLEKNSRQPGPLRGLTPEGARLVSDGGGGVDDGGVLDVHQPGEVAAHDLARRAPRAVVARGRWRRLTGFSRPSGCG